jgi:hypothetical protein
MLVLDNNLGAPKQEAKGRLSAAGSEPLRPAQSSVCHATHPIESFRTKHGSRSTCWAGKPSGLDTTSSFQLDVQGAWCWCSGGTWKTPRWCPPSLHDPPPYPSMARLLDIRVGSVPASLHLS